MNSTTHEMLLIKSIDPDASLRLSEWTRRWYVEAKIEVSDGAVLSGITEHRDSPDEAVAAYLERLREVNQNDSDHVLAARVAGDRRHFRWNGAAFVSEPLDRFVGARSHARPPLGEAQETKT